MKTTKAVLNYLKGVSTAKKDRKVGRKKCSPQRDKGEGVFQLLIDESMYLYCEPIMNEIMFYLVVRCV